MDFFQSNQGRLLGLLAGVCLWVVVKPGRDELDRNWARKVRARQDVVLLAAPDGERFFTKCCKLAFKPDEKAEELESLLDRTLARLPDDDEDARYWRDAMPANLSIVERNNYRAEILLKPPFRPKRSLLWHSRVALAHHGCEAIAWLVAPPRLQAFAVGYMATVLVRNAVAILRWALNPHRDPIQEPLRSVTFLFSRRTLLSQLLFCRAEGNTPRSGFPSALLRFGFGPAFFDQRLLMFFDILMTPSLFKSPIFSTSEAPIRIAGMQFAQDIVIHMWAARAAWWLERQVLALTDLGSAL